MSPTTKHENSESDCTDTSNDASVGNLGESRCDAADQFSRDTKHPNYQSLPEPSEDSSLSDSGSTARDTPVHCSEVRRIHFVEATNLLCPARLCPARANRLKATGKVLEPDSDDQVRGWSHWETRGLLESNSKSSCRKHESVQAERDLELLDSNSSTLDALLAYDALKPWDDSPIAKDSDSIGVGVPCHADLPKSPNKAVWRQDMKNLDILISKGTFTVTDILPEGRKATIVRGMFNGKLIEQKGIIRRKSRMVTRGVTQEDAIDIFDTYAPTRVPRRSEYWQEQQSRRTSSSVTLTSDRLSSRTLFKRRRHEPSPRM